MMHENSKGNIRCYQLNAASRVATHDSIMMWLARQNHPLIVCVQEPLLSERGFRRLPKDFTCYWSKNMTNSSSIGFEPGLPVCATVVSTTVPHVQNISTNSSGCHVLEQSGNKNLVSNNGRSNNKCKYIDKTSGCMHESKYAFRQGGIKRKAINIRESELNEQSGDTTPVGANWGVENRRYKSRRIYDREVGFERSLTGSKTSSTSTRPLQINNLGSCNSGKTGQRKPSCVPCVRTNNSYITSVSRKRSISRVSGGAQSREIRRLKRDGIERGNMGLNDNVVGFEPVTFEYQSSSLPAKLSALNVQPKLQLSRFLSPSPDAFPPSQLPSFSNSKKRPSSPSNFCPMHPTKRMAMSVNNNEKSISSNQMHEYAYNADDSRKNVIMCKKRTRVRSLIIASKCLNGYMISQHSTVDCVVVRFEALKLSMISLYCDSNVTIDVSMHHVCMEHLVSRNILICADTNAHCVRWGALGSRINRFKSYRRGDILCEYLDDLNLVVCNSLPHRPTYIGDTGHVTHIDATFCSNHLLERISNWKVCLEQFESDHRLIMFEFVNDAYSSVKDKGEVSHMVPWLKPSPKMQTRMAECLPKMVKFKRRIRSEGDMSLFVQKHTTEVNEALVRIFKKGKGKVRTPCYWWTDEVSALHKKLKLAKRRMHRYKYSEVVQEYNMCRQKFREKVKEAKISSWKVFTTNISDPWNGLMKILACNDVNKAQARTLCTAKGEYACDLRETLGLLSDQFFPKPMDFSDVHVSIEDEVNKRLINIQNGEEITVCEFRKAVNEMKKATAPGQDEITNTVLHILAGNGQHERSYIDIFNLCLRDGIFPVAWKKARIILIPKAAELLDSVKAMRPISLTSVFSKLLERIVLARVLHYVELSGNLAVSQHAYRKGGSTTTALYEASKFIQDAVHDKHVCISVFLDISGAFDRTWHGGILYRLLQYGVPTYLIKWIKCFLSDRSATFQAAGVEHSVLLNQGCPQGGVLSPVLWNVLFNDMLVMKTKSDQDFHLKVVGYADDAAVLCRAKNVKSASVILTNYLVRIREWAESNRIQFNQSKMKVLVFSKGPMISPANVLFNGFLIDEVSQYKYLGLIFDNRLTWKPHTTNLLDKLTKITRMLRGVVREKWGVKMEIMRMLFKSIFCPVLFYGIAIWGYKIMNQTMCAKFDSEIRKFCIMSTRCFRSTSNEVLFRLMKTTKFSNLAQQEVLRVSLLQLNLSTGVKDHLFDKEGMLFRRNPFSMEHFFFLCRQLMDKSSLNVVYDNLLHNYSVHPSEWEITKTCVKDRNSALWDGVSKMGWILYTDASVSSYGAGCAFAVFHHGFCIKTQGYALNKCSIFTAESRAVLYAVQYTKSIKGLRKKETVEIRCDSQAVIVALERTIITDPMLKDVKDALREVKQKGVNIVLRWVPSHAGIEGNELADKCAKMAIDSCVVRETVLVKRDLRSCIDKKVHEDTAKQWINCGPRIPKLFFPEASDFNSFLKSFPSVDLCQLVTGHCRLNEFMCNKMAVINSPMCACNEEEETVSHFLLTCPYYDHIRREVWNEFEPTFDFIRKDWKKVDDFMKRTKRFL